MRPLMLSFLGTVVSCTSLGATPPFQPPPPAPPGLQVELKWHQAVETRELIQCHYFKSANDMSIEVSHLSVDFPAGAGVHHVHIYRSESDQPDRVEDCEAGLEWHQWSLLIAVELHPLDWRLPDGVTIPVQPHEQFLVQVHLINTTSQPIDGVIHIGLETSIQTSVHLGT